MSFMDTAQLLGNLGEFIGAIVIVVTLIYLAMQVRQNTNALQAQSRQAVLSGAQAELFKLIENPDISINMSKAESLTTEEQVKLGHWFGAVMRLREFSWQQYQNGIIDDVQWSTELGIIQSVLSAHRSRTWWDSVGQNIFGAKFAAFVNDALRDQPISDDLSKKMTDWANG